MIKAIETRYKGYRFRSRLEARWAVFFDALNIEWQYEPEGFITEEGAYLPDFFLPKIREGGLWVEIKPDLGRCTFGEEAWSKMTSVVNGTQKEGVILCGLPSPYPMDQGRTEFEILFPCETPEDFSGDSPYAFCVCPWSGRIGFEFDGRGARVTKERNLSEEERNRKQRCEPIDFKRFYKSLEHGDKAYSGDHPRIIFAANQARACRFEHGENGAKAA